MECVHLAIIVDMWDGVLVNLQLVHFGMLDFTPRIAKWETKVVTIYFLWPFDLVGTVQTMTWDAMKRDHWAGLSVFKF